MFYKNKAEDCSEEQELWNKLTLLLMWDVCANGRRRFGENRASLFFETLNFSLPGS